MSATPRDAAPSVVRRQEIVQQVLDSLDGVAEVPVGEQVDRLSEAQSVLAAVLNNDSDISQMGIPGIPQDHEAGPGAG